MIVKKATAALIVGGVLLGAAPLAGAVEGPGGTPVKVTSTRYNERALPGKDGEKLTSKDLMAYSDMWRGGVFTDNPLGYPSRSQDKEGKYTDEFPDDVELNVKASEPNLNKHVITLVQVPTATGKASVLYPAYASTSPWRGAPYKPLADKYGFVDIGNFKNDWDGAVFGAGAVGLEMAHYFYDANMENLNTLGADPKVDQEAAEGALQRFKAAMEEKQFGKMVMSFWEYGNAVGVNEGSELQHSRRTANFSKIKNGVVTIRGFEVGKKKAVPMGGYGLILARKKLDNALIATNKARENMEKGAVAENSGTGKDKDASN